MMLREYRCSCTAALPIIEGHYKGPFKLSGSPVPTNSSERSPTLLVHEPTLKGTFSAFAHVQKNISLRLTGAAGVAICKIQAPIFFCTNFTVGETLRVGRGDALFLTCTLHVLMHDVPFQISSKRKLLKLLDTSMRRLSKFEASSASVVGRRKINMFKYETTLGEAPCRSRPILRNVAKKNFAGVSYI